MLAIIPENTAPHKLARIRYETYPGGEVRLVDLSVQEGHNYSVYAHIQNSNDLMALALLRNALKRENVGNVELFLPYVPYARQDRANRLPNNRALSIQVMADMLNMMKWHRVHVADPHSDVTPALIENIVVTPRELLVQTPLDILDGKFENGLHDLILVSPDAGAQKRTEEIASGTNIAGVLTGQKVRDMKTGQITATVVHGVEECDGRHVLIPDDICDGGRTFTELAKVIRERANPLSLSLYVTHGIFSQGITPIMEHFDNVFCPYPWAKNRDLGDGRSNGGGWGEFHASTHDTEIGNDYDQAFPFYDSLTITRK